MNPLIKPITPFIADLKMFASPLNTFANKLPNASTTCPIAFIAPSQLPEKTLSTNSSKPFITSIMSLKILAANLNSSRKISPTALKIGANVGRMLDAIHRKNGSITPFHNFCNLSPNSPIKLIILSIAGLAYASYTSLNLFPNSVKIG